MDTFLALYINWRRSQTCRMGMYRIVAYEEPHAGAEAGGSESVERADRVDVDGVGAVGSTGTSGTGHCVCALSDKCSGYDARAGRLDRVRERRWSTEMCGGGCEGTLWLDSIPALALSVCGECMTDLYINFH